MVKTKRRIYKSQSAVEFVVVLVVIAIINALSGYYYARIDLTKEKRYTITKTSKELAVKLTEKLYFKFYLNGEMSSMFKQLRGEIQDMAYEFREASGGKIEIEAIDPLEGKVNEERSKILQDFSDKGIRYVNDVDDEGGDETLIRYLIPGAEFNYKGNTVYASFFEPEGPVGSANNPDNIQEAIEGIEYEMASALRLCVEEPRRIAVADGNDEMVDARVQSIARELSKVYSVEALNLNIADTNAGRPFLEKMRANPDSAELILMNGLQRRLNLADLLLIIKPLHDYTPAELYLIDQFVMKGGKVMWLVDPVHIETDSFFNNNAVMALDNGLENINSTLNVYGVTLNNDLLLDANCNLIPIPVGERFQMLNFWYHVLFTNKYENHIINKSVGVVRTQFPGTLKIKDRKGVTAIPLLTSTTKTKVAFAPVAVDLMDIALQHYTEENLKKFMATMNAGPKTSGVLLEGKFQSAFANQKKFTGLKFLSEGTSKMVVIADGDIIRNQVSDKGGIYPLGYDPYNKVTFGNKKFLLNCIDYMIDDNSLIEIRGKDIGLRLLDKVRIKEEKTLWQQINVSLPIALVILFGLVNLWIRKRKYAR